MVRGGNTPRRNGESVVSGPEYTRYVNADRIEAEFNGRRENESYWRGRHDGTELLAAKDLELLAEQLKAQALSARLDDAQAELRALQLKHGGVVQYDMCWHCHICLEPAVKHCEHCPEFNSCHVEGCPAPGCE